MKHTKKMRGGFWNYFRRRDFSQEEIKLFIRIKEIREKLICHESVLKQVSQSRNFFKNINLYLGLLEEFRDGVNNSLTNGSNFSDLVANDPLNNVNMEDDITDERGHLYYGIRPTQNMVNNVNNDKILYAFLILEVQQLRVLKISLKKKLDSISGKKSYWFSSMFIKLPDGTSTANLNNARETLRIKEEIKSIIKKFCNVNIDSFYDRFYNFIRKFKLNLSSSDKKKVMKYITDIFEIINKKINKNLKENKFSTENLKENKFSTESPDNSYDNSPYNSSLDDWEEIPGRQDGGKRTKKIGRKKSRKIK